eukprot:15466054-Alexandrium_andersonii.AAC.1
MSPWIRGCKHTSGIERSMHASDQQWGDVQKVIGYMDVETSPKHQVMLALTDRLPTSPSSSVVAVRSQGWAPLPDISELLSDSDADDCEQSSG